MPIHSGYFPNSNTGGTGLTSAQLAKLNSLPNFQKRVEIVTPAVEAVAAVDAVAATLEVDLADGAQQLRARFTAKVAGVAGNSIRFRLKVAVAGETPNTMIAESDGVSYTVRVRSSGGYALSTIGIVILNFGASAPFTFEAIDNANVAITTPNVAYGTLSGGADAIAEVVGVPAVTMERAPVEGEAMLFRADGDVENDKRFKPIEVGRASFGGGVTSAFSQGDNALQIPLNSEQPFFGISIGGHDLVEDSRGDEHFENASIFIIKTSLFSNIIASVDGAVVNIGGNNRNTMIIGPGWGGGVVYLGITTTRRLLYASPSNVDQFPVVLYRIL